MNFIRNFIAKFKYNTLIIHMISGDSFKIKCKDFEFQYRGNELCSYSITGLKGKNNPIAYLKIDNIERIEEIK